MGKIIYPSVEELKMAKRTDFNSAQERAIFYSQDITEDEKKENGQLWTRYRYEVDNGLTILDYEKWIIDKLNEMKTLRKFIKDEGIIRPEDDIRELLCSKKLSLINEDVTNYRNEIIIPYGNYSDRGVYSTIENCYTYATHLFVLQEQSTSLVARCFNDRCIGTLTHAIVGRFPVYDSAYVELQRVKDSIMGSGDSTIGFEEHYKSDSDFKMHVRTYRRKLHKRAD